MTTWPIRRISSQIPCHRSTLSPVTVTILLRRPPPGNDAGLLRHPPSSNAAGQLHRVDVISAPIQNAASLAVRLFYGLLESLAKLRANTSPFECNCEYACAYSQGKADGAPQSRQTCPPSQLITSWSTTAAATQVSSLILGLIFPVFRHSPGNFFPLSRREQPLHPYLR